VLSILGNKGVEPVPLRLSEVNRMLGKVDELAVNADTRSIPAQSRRNNQGC
jgi:transcriptional antiterminator NusG